MEGVRVLRFNAFGANCAIMWDKNRKCIITDPGFITGEERMQLYDEIIGNNLKPEAILLTHGHFDHIFGVRQLSEDFGIPVYLSPADRELTGRQGKEAAMFGLPEPDADFMTFNAEDGCTVTVGDMEFEAIATPGHTPGGICWYNRKDKLLISGDTLFAGSIGRTDMQGGDYDALMNSIFTRLMVLDGDVDVIPGHGGCTTIADERQKNPFLQPFNEPYEEEGRKDE